MKIGILGGGLAGISIAYFLRDLDCEVLEEFSRIGGHCKTKKKNGFSYDMGGHIMFSKDKEMLNFELKLLEDNKQKFRRFNQIWFKGRFIKYPFENDLHSLDKEDIFDCLYHFFNNPYSRPKTNFKEWIYYNFGKVFSNFKSNAVLTFINKFPELPKTPNVSYLTLEKIFDILIKSEKDG